MIGPIIGGFMGGILPVRSLLMVTGVLLLGAMGTVYWHTMKVRIFIRKEVY
jgi:hypothetical protein